MSHKFKQLGIFAREVQVYLDLPRYIILEIYKLIDAKILFSELTNPFLRWADIARVS